MMIYLVIINFNSSELVCALIQSLQTEATHLYRIIIVNNSPSDSGLSKLSSDLITIIVNSRNLGFGCACNIALSHIYKLDPNALIWLINPDTQFLKGSIERLNIFFMFHPEISILGTAIYEPGDKCWFSGGNFNALTGSISVKITNDISRYGDYMLTTWISGCSLIINLKLFHECPQFSSLFFLYYEDFEFCMRYSMQGHLISITNLIHVIHFPSSITNRAIHLKLKHSTYGYLISLSIYTTKVVFIIRLIRIVIYAIIMFPLRPNLSRGKFLGLLMYFMKQKS